MKKNRQLGLLVQTRGAMAIMTVIVVSAAALIIAMNAILLGLGDLELGYTSQQGSFALSIADGCAEEAMQNIRKDANYGLAAGPLGLTMDEGTCTIDVTDMGSGTREIIVESTHDIYHRSIRILLTLHNGSITLDSWEEVE